MNIAVQIAFFAFVPAGVRWACQRWRPLKLLSPVIVCYLIGIAVGNQPFLKSTHDISQDVAAGAVLMAIALMLVATDLRVWLRLAPVTLRSVGLALVSVIVVSVVVALTFGRWLGDSWKIAGMLVGVYTGGTPNMAAIATALQVDPSTFIMVHTSDVLVCGLYFVFLLLLAGRLFGYFLKPFERTNREQTPLLVLEQVQHSIGIRDVGLALGLGVVLLAFGGGVRLLFPSGAQDAVTILCVTSAALALSFSPRVRSLRAAYLTGDYMLLIFCVAVGTMAEFDTLSRIPFEIFAYTTSVVIGTVCCHLLLCRIFNVDRDTCIITSTAAIFGPAFIGPVAVVLHNKEIVVSGIMSGLIGFALGNYLGLLVAYALRMVFV